MAEDQKKLKKLHDCYYRLDDFHEALERFKWAQQVIRIHDDVHWRIDDAEEEFGHAWWGWKVLKRSTINYQLTSAVLKKQPEDDDGADMMVNV